VGNGADVIWHGADVTGLGAIQGAVAGKAKVLGCYSDPTSPAPNIGAWKLVSYEEHPVDGSPTFYPMSEKPQGIIMYTPDGHMSAQLSKPDRKPFASGDWFKGTDEDYKAQGSTYVAYTGQFHVDEEAKTLTHSMFISLFPNWIGQTQPRVVKIEGDELQLSTASHIQSGGKTVNSSLKWKRREKLMDFRS
jgi:Lipocalin-like domain